MEQYRVGVLIIGSLLWDDHDSRKSWRTLRLIPEDGFVVPAPIRYGRFSDNRGAYTMVFSKGVRGARSSARVLPCKQPVSTVQDLIIEAKHLWTAERRQNKSDGRISAPWGCVALRIRPGLKLPRPFLDGWAQHVRGEDTYGNIRQTKKEGVLVDKRGLLHIGWPESIDPESPNELDLILATATQPTFHGNSRRYPTPKMIAEAWGKDMPNEFEYFRMNRRNSICTFQDQKIMAHLEQHFRTLYESVAKLA